MRRGRGISVLLALLASLALVACGRIDFDLNGLTPRVSMSAGGDHACTLSAGAIFCWGQNADGELGDGTTTPSSDPVRVAGLAAPATQVSAGHFHTCAVAGGEAYCWGRGTSGELGDGTGRSSTAPVRVVGLPSGGVTRVSAGRSFSCAVADGQAYCWGSNGAGRLGTGSAADGETTAQRISDWDDGVSYIFAGGDHAIAIVDGAAFTWGHDDGGALGSGMSLGSSSVPVAVVGITGTVVEGSMGGFTGCARADGAVYCWGTGSDGELGDGAMSNSTTPVSTSGMESGVTSMQMGGGPVDGDAPCAVRDGAAYCWGNNGAGRLGDGTTTPRATPVPVQGLPAPVHAVEGGFSHTCAVLVDSRIFCWGAGAAGQLGHGDSTNSLTPVEVSAVWDS